MNAASDLWRGDASEPPRGEKIFDLRELFRALLRRWRVIVGATLAVGLIGLLFTLLSPRTYTATALVMVSPRQENVVASEEVVPELPPESAVVESELEIIRSRALLGKLVDKLNLAQDPAWNSGLRSKSLLASAKGWIAAPLRALRGSPEAPAAGDPAYDPDRERAVSAVAEAVRAERRRLSYVIEVKVDAPTPRQAARMVNTLVELYLAAQMDARFDAAQRANSWLSDRLTTLKADVESKEAAAEAYRSQNGLLTAQGTTLTEQKASDLQASTIVARTDLAEKEARLRQLRQMIARGGSADSIAGAITSDTIRELRSQEAEVARRQAELESRYGDLHPTLQKVRQERADIRAQIDSEVRRIASNLENEVEVARSRLGELQAGSSSVRGELAVNNKALVKLRELERDAAATRAVYENFLMRFQEISEQESLKITDSRLVASATPPSSPSSPNVQLGVAISLVIGLALGLALAFLWEALDDGLNSSEDIEDKLALPALAIVPIVRTQDLNQLPADKQTPGDYLVERPASEFAEAFRSLRTSLMYSDLDRRLQIVAVTSAILGEGKTTTSLCLGRIAAMAGQNVIVVDCDRRRRSLSSMLGMETDAGIVEVLTGRANWRDAVRADTVTGMHIIPAAAPSFKPDDIFGSEAMRVLLSELRRNYDLVVLDCAPELTIAESRVIARMADATILVARWARTPVQAVRAALEHLTHAGAHVAGVVLGQVDTRAPGRVSPYDSAYYTKGYVRYYAN